MLNFQIFFHDHGPYTLGKEISGGGRGICWGTFLQQWVFFIHWFTSPLIYKLWMNGSLQQQEATAWRNPRASGGAWRRGRLLAGKLPAGAACNQSCWPEGNVFSALTRLLISYWQRAFDQRISRTRGAAARSVPARIPQPAQNTTLCSAPALLLPHNTARGSGMSSKEQHGCLTALPVPCRQQGVGHSLLGHLPAWGWSSRRESAAPHCSRLMENQTKTASHARTVG